MTQSKNHGGKGDTRQASWTKTYQRLMRNVSELKQHGYPVGPEPVNFHVHPDFRSSR